jgi:hypothetical protein
MRLYVEIAAISMLIAALGLTLWDKQALQAELATQASVVTTLQGAVEYQNTAILGLRDRGQLLEAQASSAARAVLLAGRRTPLPAGHGPAAMNTWLAETFPPEVRHAP